MILIVLYQNGCYPAHSASLIRAVDDYEIRTGVAYLNDPTW